jgi:hypothetical protein
MKVFTIAERVSPGATVSFVNFERAGLYDIPAIVIGEKGKGRKESIIPVDIEAIDTDIDTKESKINNVIVGKSTNGGPKLFKAIEDDIHFCLLVIRTPIGFRGYSQHNGDRYAFVCDDDLCRYKEEILPLDDLPLVCPNCGESRTLRGLMLPFPGEHISWARIGEGPNGKTAGSMQYITVMPKDAVFRIALGNSEHKMSGSTYYCYNGKNLNALTWSERRIVEIF